MHNLSRYEFVNRDSPIVFTKPQNKRLNQGGCTLIEGEVEFEADQTSIQLAELLFNFVFLKQSEDDEIRLGNFIQSLERLNKNAVYRTIYVPNRTGGMQIMNRIISISRAYQATPKQCENYEIHQIDFFLLKKIDFLTQETANQFKCTFDQLKMISEERTIELSKRLWSLEEDTIIMQHLSDTFKNKDVSNMLICRTVDDVKKRRKFLRKELAERKKSTK